MKLVLRAATQKDLPVLERIERESFPSPHWKARDFLAYETTVAETSGEITGFLVARQVFSGSETAPSEREILNVATAVRFRRQGIATALMEHEMQRRATWFLEVRESNTAAQKLYRKFGLVEVARRAGYYQNPAETAIVMQLKRC